MENGTLLHILWRKRVILLDRKVLIGVTFHVKVKKLVTKNVLGGEGLNVSMGFCTDWSQRGHVQRRNVDSKTIEWMIADRKWLQTYLTPPFTPPFPNGGVKSFDELTDDLWLDFVKNIERRSAKDSFKEALVATIEWGKQKNDP